MRYAKATFFTAAMLAMTACNVAVDEASDDRSQTSGSSDTIEADGTGQGNLSLMQPELPSVEASGEEPLGLATDVVLLPKFGLYRIKIELLPKVEPVSSEAPVPAENESEPVAPSKPVLYHGQPILAKRVLFDGEYAPGKEIKLESIKTGEYKLKISVFHLKQLVWEGSSDVKVESYKTVPVEVVLKRPEVGDVNVKIKIDDSKPQCGYVPQAIPQYCMEGQFECTLKYVDPSADKAKLLSLTKASTCGEIFARVGVLHQACENSVKLRDIKEVKCKGSLVPPPVLKNPLPSPN